MPPRFAGPEREKRSAAADRHADAIRIALMEAAPAGLTSKRLVAATELSRSQLVCGIAALKELCAERGWPPLLWTREKG
ncbi:MULTISPECIES: hypothetical protein [Streptomyces]|uniref:Transcriptional regulator n=1 Tax=Streptomyces ehimensis TaxID=68195 RepID=A0ABV9BUR0_9ACTN